MMDSIIVIAINLTTQKFQSTTCSENLLQIGFYLKMFECLLIICQIVQSIIIIMLHSIITRFVWGN